MIAQNKEKNRLIEKMAPWLIRLALPSAISVATASSLVDIRLSALETKEAVTDKAQEDYQRDIARALDQLREDVHYMRQREDAMFDRKSR